MFYVVYVISNPCKMIEKTFFFVKQNSGDIGLMVQMLDLNFVAAAVSNY